MEIKGILTAGRGARFSGFRITADYQEIVQPAGDGSPEVVAPAARSAEAADDGTFAVTVPDAKARRGPVLLRAVRPDGLVAGSIEVPEGGDGGALKLPVTLGEPTLVAASEEPALGAQLRITGRVIDTAGRAAEPELIDHSPGDPELGE